MPINAIHFADGDWTGLKRTIRKLAHNVLGPDASPEFTGLTLSGLTATRLVSTDADKLLASTDLVNWVAGTTNQVTVADDSDGTITLSLPQDIHTAATPTFAGATIGSVVIPAVYTAQGEPTGFVDRTATLSWDDGTYTLTITGDHDIYIDGIKYSKTTDSIQITDATDLHYIYYNSSGVLSKSTSWPGFNVALMAFVYWNTTINKGRVCEERHGLTMDGATHEYLHNTVGVRYESGLAGTFDNTTLTITAGTVYDEDLDIDITEQTDCSVMYKNGDANWAWDADSSIYYKLNGANLRYNNGNALADVGNNKYVAMWLFATNDISTPIVALMGQREDTTLANARLNNKYESLSFGELPYAEMKILYRVILRNTGTPPTYIEAQDLRSVSTVSSGTYIATAHNTLTGLDADDHTIYPLLLGRVTGQTLAGSDTTAEDLTLKDNTVDNNTITVTQAIAAYTHSNVVVGNPHVVTPTELSLVIGTNTQAWDAGLDSLAALTYVNDSFIKVTATDVYAIRTIAETKTDLSLNLVENTALTTWVGANTIVTVGTIATGTWEGTTVAVLQGGTGQTTVQAAIDSLSAVAGGGNEHVLTKDTGTGNALWKASAAGANDKVKIDVGAAAAGYIGAAAGDGVLRTTTGLSYADGGDFVTLGLSHLGFENLASPAPNDRIVFWDNSASKLDWLSASSGLSISGTAIGLGISGLGADATPDGAADYVATYDNSGATHKKVLLDNLPGGASGTISVDNIFMTAQATADADQAGKGQLWAKTVAGTFSELSVSVWNASSESGADVIEQADDDNAATYWSATSDAAEWGSADMGSAKTVTKVAIHSKADAADGVRCKSFNLEYSDNNSDWSLEEAFQHTNVDGNEEFTVTTPSSHRYWRIYVTDRWGVDGSWIHLHEITFYETGSATQEIWFTESDGTDNKLAYA